VSSNDIDELKTALREVGLYIPDEVQNLAHLIIAIKASGGCGMGGPPRKSDPLIDQDGDSPSMLLSATHRGGRSSTVDPKVLEEQERLAKERSIPAKK
jgi:hypothetical protein